MNLIGSDLLHALKAMALGVGSGHLYAVVGIAIGSIYLNKWLKRRGYLNIMEIVDRFAYLAGGLIALNLFFRLLHHTAQVFGLY